MDNGDGGEKKKRKQRELKRKEDVYQNTTKFGGIIPHSSRTDN